MKTKQHDTVPNDFSITRGLRAMQKRTFLLLEILIAFFIVAVCLVPLVTQPLKLYRSDLKFLEELERERLADWTFTEIKEKLLKHQIPWEKIPKRGVYSSPFSLPDATIEIPGCSPKIIERSFTLHCRGEKTGIKGEIYRSVWIYIAFSPLVNPKEKHSKSYTFRLLVQFLPKESAT
jgi:hypothetical protein